MSWTLAARPEVESDLEEGFDWYERQRPGLGAEFLAAIDATLDRIVAHPTLHAAGHRGVRATAVKRFPYVVHYLVDERRVLIIAVLHGSRHGRTWRQRLDEK